MLDTEVKNVGMDLRLRPREVDLEKCRPIRRHCASVAFCCYSHLMRCRRGTSALDVNARGGREPLSVQQLTKFVHELVKGDGPVWPAVLLLVQLFLGERADAARHARVGWFQNIEPSALGAPFVALPRVNKKTTAREIPLPYEFAKMLYTWMHTDPLQNSKHRWPFFGQVVHAKESLLFPGQAKDHSRTWDKPITERAYLKMLKAAAEQVGRERAVVRLAGTGHIFDGVSLDRIGTHSVKKSFVSALKSAKFSTAVISVLTGTTARTLDSTYDVPTTQRQRNAVQEVIAPVLSSFMFAPTAASAQPVCCCTCCGARRQDASWNFCRQCGQQFVQ